jgi:hypothetical protein
MIQFLCAETNPPAEPAVGALAGAEEPAAARFELLFGTLVLALAL